MRRSYWLGLSGVVAYLLGGCTAQVSTVGGDSGSPGKDAGSTPDAGPGVDAGSGNDAGPGRDAGGTTDSGSGDAGFIGFDVLQHHLNASRDGFYSDPYLTKAAIATMHVDTAFHGTTGSGATYAQPLFLANGAKGAPSIFVATQSNDVYALDALTGAQQWTVNLGTPAQNGDMGCGNIFPMGVLSTPVIDPASRRIFIGTLIHSANKPHHTVFALNIDDGTTAWSLDVGATITGFPTSVQGERGALLFLNGVLYVPYGGLDGDCGNYHGWVIAIPPGAPQNAKGYATAAPSGSGIWAMMGIASDGTSLFVATGNTNNSPFPTVWANADSEAVVRLSAATPPLFSGASADYFAGNGGDGMEWYRQDQGDADLGSAGVVLFDVPCATPSALALAVGKTQKVYLLDRNNMGGITDGLQNAAKAYTTNAQVFAGLFAYRTATASYVGMKQPVNGCNGGDLSVLKVTA
ncbi:MAG TPA: hypothetical protein VH137_10840, partial [Gemmatimonadales bacterium]|nr:hypothetical protein [Gemmatimonadales bacterium]